MSEQTGKIGWVDMTVDDAMRLIFTLGVVAPPWPDGRRALPSGKAPPDRPGPVEPGAPDG